MNAKQALLVLAGIGIGCGVAAVAPLAASRAQATEGEWGCYVADRLPDARSAAEWSGAADIKAGLDQVAGHVARGTILSIAPKSGGYVDVVCVKF